MAWVPPRLGSRCARRREAVAAALADTQAGLVVDVGCGEGALLRSLCGSNPRLSGIGIDRSPARVRTARRLAEATGLDRVRFLHEDWLAPAGGLSEALAGRRADLLVFVRAFHRMADPVAGARRAFDICADGGRVLVLDRDTESSLLTGLWGWACRLLGIGARFYTAGELGGILARAGFRRVRVLWRQRGRFAGGRPCSSLALVEGHRDRPAHCVGLPDAAAPEQALEALRGRRLLVTGAAGFLGGHLLARLAAAGLEVVGTVRDADQAARLSRAGRRCHILDLRDPPGGWSDLLRGVDVVFHLAACFQELEARQEEFELVNHRATLDLARAALGAGVSRFVHCSTAGVYGDVLELPATEDTPFRPMDLYQASKLAGERALLDLARTSGERMTLTVNRPTMAYGPEDRRLGKLFSSILAGRFVMLGSGLTLAHLDYVEDQTDSFLLSATAPREVAHAQCFNIASDRPLALRELVRLVAECGGVPAPRWALPVAPVYALASLCELAWRPLRRRPPLFRRRIGFFTHNRAFDLSKARSELGYASRWSHRAGIERTLAWHRSLRAGRVRGAGPAWA